MYLTVPLALFGILFAGPLLFALMPARRAAILTMLLGTMFLPNAAYQVPILRSFDKGTATVLATLLGILLFDSGRLMRYRFHWVDIPMVVWCLCPLASSLSNGLGFYDGLAEIMQQLNLFGLPYFIGRLYITDREGAAELARWLLIGGLTYVPFCLWEMKGGPFFHSKVYGFYPHNWWEQLKPGGWRPSVFFIHGLWLGGFMAYASICGVCLWRSKVKIRVWGLHLLGCPCGGRHHAHVQIERGNSDFWDGHVGRVCWPVSPAGMCAADPHPNRVHVSSHQRPMVR